MNELKKYTVIYAESFMSGSRNIISVKYKHLTCVPKDLNKIIELEIGWGNLYYVFDGHCEDIEI